MKISKPNFTKKELINLFIFLGIALALIGIDLLTKWLCQNHFVNEISSGEYASKGITIIPNFCYIILQHNEGMAWSLGSGDIGFRIFFIIISFIASVALTLYLIFKFKTMNNWYRTCIVMMIAGAAGNFIDRAFYWTNTVGFSGVIDWIKFLPFGKDFPTFNIADALLVVGVIILIVLLLIEAIKDFMIKNKRGDFKLTPDELKAKLEAEEKAQQEQETKENEAKSE